MSPDVVVWGLELGQCEGKCEVWSLASQNAVLSKVRGLWWIDMFVGLVV